MNERCGRRRAEKGADACENRAKQSQGHRPEDQADMVYFGHGAPEQEGTLTALLAAALESTIIAARGEEIKADSA